MNLKLPESRPSRFREVHHLAKIPTPTAKSRWTFRSPAVRLPAPAFVISSPQYVPGSYVTIKRAVAETPEQRLAPAVLGAANMDVA